MCLVVVGNGFVSVYCIAVPLIVLAADVVLARTHTSHP